MIMLQSKELVNYNGEKPYIKAAFEIEAADGHLNGRAWVEDFEALKVELSEKLDGDQFVATKSMKYWLEANLCNLLLEFENGVIA